MRWYFVFIWGLVTVLFISISHAEESLPALDEQSGLEDYLTYAALNNPRLEAAFHRWKAALERVPQAESLPDPRFSYRYYIEAVETRRGPMRQAVDLTQTFPYCRDKNKLGLCKEFEPRFFGTGLSRKESAWGIIIVFNLLILVFGILFPPVFSLDSVICEVCLFFSTWFHLQHQSSMTPGLCHTECFLRPLAK